MRLSSCLSRATLVILCLLPVIGGSRSRSTKESRKELIQTLFEKTAALQNLKDVPFKTLESFRRQKGLYESEVRLNFHGEWAMAMSRRVGFPDNNMFVTAWVTSALLEAMRYQDVVRPSSQQLESALDAIYSHRDRNAGYQTSGYAFWQQFYNQTTKFWSSQTVNILGVMDLADDMPISLMVKLLEELGLKKLAQDIKSLYQEESTFKASFRIPPDFDDTFVNLGLGSLLFEMKSQFSTAWNKWNKYNQNITSAFNDLKEYAYRPFSKNNNSNSLDPRSYYVIRHFLDKGYNSGQDLALVTTWIQNIDELRTQFYKGTAMPFQVNNVDITVAANTIYGVTSAILAGLVTADVLNDKYISQIYFNTSSLVAHQLNNNITDRPDLALLYYPSQIEFDWFVSRTVDLMETKLLTSPLPHPVMKTVLDVLRNATTGAMTKSIVSKARTDETKDVYFDDFLGNGDVTLDNKPLNRAEDRIFTTAMAANALLYTWTSCNGSDTNGNNAKCQWKKGIPDDVRSTIDGSIKWLMKHTLDEQYKPWNAFFSGSAKGLGSLPFWYPGNRLEFLNGTAITDWKHLPNSVDYLYAMRGYVTSSNYDAMLQKPHFGETTPRIFNGYNAGDGCFPLWSSDSYTYSVTLLALSRYDNTVTG